MLDLNGFLLVIGLLFLIPLFLPWGDTMLSISLVIWLVLWGMFFYAVNNPSEQPDRLGGDVVYIGVFILVLTLGLIVRLVAWAFGYMMRQPGRSNMFRYNPVRNSN